MISSALPPPAGFLAARPHLSSVARPVMRSAALDSNESMSDLLRLLGVDPLASAALETRVLMAKRVKKGNSLFLEGAVADRVYAVRFGSFKLVRVDQDGFEHVLDFVGPGELLALDALGRGQHPTTAVALEDAGVYCLPTADLHGWRRQCLPLDQVLQRAMSNLLSRRYETVEILSAVGAEVRLSRFLLQLSSRLVQSGRSQLQIHLPMSRRDIASYLGVAHETISRSMSTLADRGCVTVSNREVHIHDLEGLKACARRVRPPREEALLKA